MKRIIALGLAIILLLSLFACGDGQMHEPSREEVVAAYEAAGYQVSHRACEENEEGRVYVIVATHPNGDYLNIDFFDSVEHAEAYAEKHEYNLLVWMFSAIFGDPSWAEVERCGSIVIVYDEDELYEPFEALLS